MQQNFHDQIILIEERVHILETRLRKPDLSQSERELFEKQMGHAKIALDHYRKAYELAQKIKSPQNAA